MELIHKFLKDIPYKKNTNFHVSSRSLEYYEERKKKAIKKIEQHICNMEKTSITSSANATQFIHSRPNIISPFKLHPLELVAYLITKINKTVNATHENFSNAISFLVYNIQNLDAINDIIVAYGGHSVVLDKKYQKTIKKADNTAQKKEANSSNTTRVVNDNNLDVNRMKLLIEKIQGILKAYKVLRVDNEASKEKITNAIIDISKFEEVILNEDQINLKCTSQNLASQDDESKSSQYGGRRRKKKTNLLMGMKKMYPTARALARFKKFKKRMSKKNKK